MRKIRRFLKFAQNEIMLKFKWWALLQWMWFSYLYVFRILFRGIKIFKYLISFEKLNREQLIIASYPFASKPNFMTYFITYLWLNGIMYIHSTSHLRVKSLHIPSALFRHKILHTGINIPDLCPVMLPVGNT